MRCAWSHGLFVLCGAGEVIPFNSKHNYAAPIGSKAAGAAFKDTWTLSDIDEAWWGEIAETNLGLYKTLEAAKHTAGNSAMSYLIYMAVRMLELHRILKRTGSCYLHCDPTMSHYLKAVLDAVFGLDSFRNEIVWKRVTAHNDPSRYGAVHDIVLFYTKSEEWTWNRVFTQYAQEYVDRYYKYQDKRGRFWTNTITGAGTGNGESSEPWYGYDPAQHGRHWSPPKTGEYAKYVEKTIKNYSDTTGVHARLNLLDEHGFIIHPKRRTSMPQLKTYLEGMPGIPLQDIFADIQALQGLGHSKLERLGYPTQKPLALLERMIRASSSEGDFVLDPFCGCATACSAAERLNRKWVGIDISDMAYELIKTRLVREAGITKFTKGAGIIIHRTDIPIRKGRRSHDIKHTLFGKQAGRCNLCEHEFEFRHMETDHIVPKSKGGHDDDSNLQLLCGHCNRVKSDGTMAEARVRLKDLGVLK